jgi:hypothetical protein
MGTHPGQNLLFSGLQTNHGSENGNGCSGLLRIAPRVDSHPSASSPPRSRVTRGEPKLKIQSGNFLVEAIVPE